MFTTAEVLDRYVKQSHAIISALETANNGDVPSGENTLGKLKKEIEIKREKLIGASEKVLNEYFVLSGYISFLIEYIEVWENLKSNNFSSSWTSLQNAMDALRIIKRFSARNIHSKHLYFFENQLLNLEKLYPYTIFFSIGAAVEYFECSICGNNINDSECPHMRGELYGGVMAVAIAKNLVELDHAALVKYPEDKRCVVQYEDSGEQFKLVRYLAELLNGKRLKPFDFGELSFSKKTIVNPDFVKLGRNRKCFCGSGKKFKHCCFDKKTIEGNHIDIISNPTTVRQAIGPLERQ